MAQNSWSPACWSRFAGSFLPTARDNELYSPETCAANAMELRKVLHGTVLELHSRHDLKLGVNNEMDTNGVGSLSLETDRRCCGAQ